MSVNPVTNTINLRAGDIPPDQAQATENSNDAANVDNPGVIQYAGLINTAAGRQDIRQSFEMTVAKTDEANNIAANLPDLTIDTSAASKQLVLNEDNDLRDDITRLRSSLQASASLPLYIRTQAAIYNAEVVDERLQYRIASGS